MRRTTAAAVGTLTGAALILGVRLSVATTPLAAPPPQFDAAETAGLPEATPSAGASKRPARASEADEEQGERVDEGDEPSGGDDDRAGGERDDEPAAGDTERGGLRDGRFTGTPSSNPYGVVQVAVAITNGRVTGTAVTYPRTGQSASINAGAVPKLKEQTLRARSAADIDTVSGATYTSQSYVESLQAALDAAGG